MVKNPPPKQETWVWSLGWEDPLEMEMDTHFSILAWRIPWLPTQVFLPENFHGQRSLVSCIHGSLSWT